MTHEEGALRIAELEAELLALRTEGAGPDARDLTEEEETLFWHSIDEMISGMSRSGLRDMCAGEWANATRLEHLESLGRED